MVSAWRQDTITRRKFPLQRRDSRNRHNPLLRQRHIRNSLTYSRTLFIDRDDILPHIIQAVNEQTNTHYELTFAPPAPVSEINNSVVKPPLLLKNEATTPRHQTPPTRRPTSGHDGRQQ